MYCQKNVILIVFLTTDCYNPCAYVCDFFKYLIVNEEDETINIILQKLLFINYQNILRTILHKLKNQMIFLVRVGKMLR